jgi:hypothetical protein
VPRRAAAILIVLLVVGVAATANPGVPHWLILRVHTLVVSDQKQGERLTAAEAQVAALQTQLDNLTGELNHLQACTTTLPVRVAHVRSLRGAERRVLRLGAPPGRYHLVRIRNGC